MDNVVQEPERGYKASADFTGLHNSDIDGNTVTLVMDVHGYSDEKPNYREAAYGFVRQLVRRDSAAVTQLYNM